MMGVSQEPEDKRTLQEKLDELQKMFPIGSYWCECYTNKSIEHNNHYHWVYGYETYDKDSKNVTIKTQTISYTNDSWYMKKGIGNISTYNTNLIPCTKEEFLKEERSIERGYSLISSIIDTNKLFISSINTDKQSWNFPIKQLNELESGDKFLYFLVGGTVIRFGEKKDEFKSFNGKYDETYNSTMRHLSYHHKTDDFHTNVSKMSNWNLNDKADYLIISDDFFNTLNEIFDDITFYYDSVMLCETNEEILNLRRKYQLDKIFQD